MKKVSVGFEIMDRIDEDRDLMEWAWDRKHLIIEPGNFHEALAIPHIVRQELRERMAK